MAIGPILVRWVYHHPICSKIRVLHFKIVRICFDFRAHRYYGESDGYEASWTKVGQMYFVLRTRKFTNQ